MMRVLWFLFFLVFNSRPILAAEADPAVFTGIDDPLVLPLLRTLYEKPGRWNVSPEDGRFLYNLVLQKGYKNGLEIGTSNGYSTLWLALAFRRNGGRLITIEVDRERATEARENFRAAHLNDIIDSRLNDAYKEIPKLTGPFDFVFLDAWKADNKRFLELVWPKVLKGGAIASHNVIDLRSEMDDFLWHIKTSKELETKIYETSSAGISVSVKLK